MGAEFFLMEAITARLSLSKKTDSNEGVLVESSIAEEGKDSLRITFYKSGCIYSNVPGYNLLSRYFVLKYNLEMLIEGIIMNFSIGVKLSRRGGWVETAARTRHIYI